MTKEELTRKCADIFLEEGVKISTDELARLLVMSKRTLYTLFDSKEEIITSCFKYILQQQIALFDQYHSQMQSNAIYMILPISSVKLNQEMNKLNRFLREVKKYHPDIYLQLMERHHLQMRDKVQEIILQGQKEGLFNTKLNAQLMAAILTMSHKETIDTIVMQDYSAEDVFYTSIVIWIKGMCTPKGIDILNEAIAQEGETIIQDINTYIIYKKNELYKK